VCGSEQIGALGCATLKTTDAQFPDGGRNENNWQFTTESNNEFTKPQILPLMSVFDSILDVNAPDTAIAPYTSQTVAADGSYAISSLPARNYTLAFSCQAANDDPDILDGIAIPLPEAEIVELT
jgi:hypothetical protein